MFDLLKNMGQMKAKMAEVQAELSKQEVEASSGGGVVTARVNGTGQLVKLEIDPELTGDGDIDMLQDLVVAAVNEAVRRSQDIAKKELSKLTGGLNIPGLF